MQYSIGSCSNWVRLFLNIALICHVLVMDSFIMMNTGLATIELKNVGIKIMWIDRIMNRNRATQSMMPIIGVSRDAMTCNRFPYSVSLAICAGNPSVTTGFSHKASVIRNIDIFFDVKLNKMLNRQSSNRWFMMSTLPCHVTINCWLVGTAITLSTSINVYAIRWVVFGLQCGRRIFCQQFSQLFKSVYLIVILLYHIYSICELIPCFETYISMAWCKIALFPKLSLLTHWKYIVYHSIY